MKNDIETLIIDRFIIDMNEGKYKINDKLPSENEMADLYGVPRISVRKAYVKLEEMGYLYPKQGKGRYVKDRQQAIELVLSGNESFSKKMLCKGYHLVSNNVICEKIDYDRSIFQELHVEKSDAVYKIGRLRIINGVPMALHISYVAKSVFTNIEQESKGIESMFQYYKQNGYKAFDSEKSILRISFPTLKERELLQCSNLIPLLTVETNCVDAVSKKVLEYTNIVYRSDCFKYIVP